jgi:hypothetical protein
MDNINLDKLVADAKETRDLRRERNLGFLIGFIVASVICSCSFGGFLYWAYTVGSNLPK